MMRNKRLVPPPRFLFALDGRWKMILLVAACFINQYLPPVPLAVWLAGLALTLCLPEFRTGTTRVMLRAGMYFILFWSVMTIGSDLVLARSFAAGAAVAVPLALRLLGFTLTGIIFAAVAQPLETGRAVAWFLQPFLGKRAWKPALALALTAWFLPLTLRLAGQVRAGMQARGLALSWRQYVGLLLSASLRILEETAAELAVGLASRRLDDERSWLWR